MPGINDSNTSAIRKVHAKRCKDVSEDVSTSLIYILYNNGFGIVKNIHTLLEKYQGHGTDSIYHSLAMELNHQLGQTYNGVGIDLAALNALMSVSREHEEVTAASLSTSSRKMSVAQAKKQAKTMQTTFTDVLSEHERFWILKLPVPK